MSFLADGSMRLGGMTLPANGWRVTVEVAGSNWVVNGSKMGSRFPCGVSAREKSPFFCASVGMVSTALDGCVARHCSYEKKLKSLFFLIGWPMVPPQMFCLMTFSLRSIRLARAFRAGLRPK